MTPRIGDKLPPFTLQATGGKPIGLADLKGRKAVIYFYPKDDTTGCTKEAIDFTALKKDFAEAKTEVIGISADSLKSHEKFAKKHGLDLTLAADEDRTLIDALGLWVEKSMYGRAYMGIERTTILLDADGRIARIWPKVSVPGHAEEVLEAAKAL